MWKTLSFLSLMLLSQAAMSAQLTGDYPICFSYSSLKEIWTALTNKDQRQFSAIIKAGDCLYPKKGVEVSFISKIDVVDKIRVYAENESFEMYTIPGAYK